jgi:hypothetical protein
MCATLEVKIFFILLNRFTSRDKAIQYRNPKKRRNAGWPLPFHGGKLDGSGARAGVIQP